MEILDGYTVVLLLYLQITSYLEMGGREPGRRVSWQTRNEKGVHVLIEKGKSFIRMEVIIAINAVNTQLESLPAVALVFCRQSCPYGLCSRFYALEGIKKSFCAITGTVCWSPLGFHKCNTHDMHSRMTRG